MIVVTPYLVRPVSAGQIALPTDGFRNANEPQRLLVGQEHDSRNGERGRCRPPAGAATVDARHRRGRQRRRRPPASGAPAAGAAPAAPPPRQRPPSAQPGFDF